MRSAINTKKGVSQAKKMGSKLLCKESNDKLCLCSRLKERSNAVVRGHFVAGETATASRNLKHLVLTVEPPSALPEKHRPKNSPPCSGNALASGSEGVRGVSLKLQRSTLEIKWPPKIGYTLVKCFNRTYLEIAFLYQEVFQGRVF